MTVCVDCGVLAEEHPRGGFTRCADCHNAMIQRVRKSLRAGGRTKGAPKVDHDRRAVLTDEDRARLEAHRAASAPTAAEAYRDRVKKEAADRASADADQLVAQLTSRGPLGRTEAAKLLAMTPGRVGKAAKVARERRELRPPVKNTRAPCV